MNTTAKPFDFSIENAWVREPANSRIVANDAETDAGTLLELAGHRDFYVRRSVANNPNTPGKALTSLDNDMEEQVRFYLAANPRTPIETLQKLACDISSDVRSQVAGNCHTPLELLEKLAMDSAPETLRQLAENTNTPTHILEKISQRLLELARNSPISSDEAVVLRSLARNPHTCEATLEQICQINHTDNHYWVLALGVVKNPNITVDLLTKLANHPEIDVRVAVAQHTKTPVEVLEQLESDREYPVRQAVKQRFSTLNTDQQLSIHR